MDRDLAAAQMRALGEPNRLDLFLRLAASELGGTDLLRLTGLSQPNLSRHLKVLREAGVIQERWEGRNAYYRLSGGALALEIARQLGVTPAVPAPGGQAQGADLQHMRIDAFDSTEESTSEEPEGSPPLEDWML